MDREKGEKGHKARPWCSVAMVRLSAGGVCCSRVDNKVQNPKPATALRIDGLDDSGGHLPSTKSFAGLAETARECGPGPPKFRRRLPKATGLAAGTDIRAHSRLRQESPLNDP